MVYGHRFEWQDSLETNTKSSRPVQRRSRDIKSSTSLMDLPTEIRFLIMEELILIEGSPKIRVHPRLDLFKYSPVIRLRVYPSKPCRPYHPLLMACKTLSQEYMKMQLEHSAYSTHHKLIPSGSSFEFDRHLKAGGPAKESKFGDLQVKRLRLIIGNLTNEPGHRHDRN